MIKKLQRKFVLMTMGSLLIVMTLLLGVVQLVNLQQLDARAEQLLTLLSDNDGRFPKDQFKKPEEDGPRKRPLGMTEETPFETRYFTVLAEGAGVFSRIDTGHIAAVSSSDAATYATQVLKEGNVQGYLDSYKYRATKTSVGTLLIFVDCGSQLHAAWSFFGSSLLVGLGCLAVVFLLVSVLSRRAIRPVLESMEKQKRFITDAGHEIKTPLAIISANTEVLEMTGEASEWTQSIRNQVGRLSALVQQMLALSRLEEAEKALPRSQFPFSDAVAETAEPFVTLAESQGKTLLLSIQPDLVYCGEEASLRQLTSILLDNAVKHSTAGGQIILRLTQKGKGLFLEVENPCAELPQGDLKRLFDRFYRADDARTQASGGYGIGLSIAQAIVEAHYGKIIAKQSERGSMVFLVQL